MDQDHDDDCKKLASAMDGDSNVNNGNTPPATDIELHQHILQLEQALAESQQTLELHSATLHAVLQHVSDQLVIVAIDTGQIVEGTNKGHHLWEVRPFLDHSSRQDFWMTHLSQASIMNGNNNVNHEWEQDGWKLLITRIPCSSNSSRVVVKMLSSQNQEGIQGIELALKESEERHRNLFESMVQGVVYQAQGGDIIAANPSAERILGLTVDQMMGRTSVDPRWRSIHEDGSDYPGQTHPSMVALATGKPVTGAVMGVFHPNDESTHWIVIDAIPRFRNNEKQPYQVYTTFTDITERKRYEREILAAKKRAEEGDKLKSAFLANMSHEIRTPLNGILGHLELAIGSQLSEDTRHENLEGLKIAMQSGRLLVNIIEDILDLSKIEAGQMDVSKDQAFPLRQIVQQVTNIGNMLITQRKKTIVLRTHVEMTIANSIYGDFFRIQQVLNNLVSNAIKFTDTGFVEIRVGFLEGTPESKTLLFEIEDTGKGISDRHASIVFEPFRQVDFGDTRKHGGTGLGLTISKKLVQLMDGDLSVKSKLNAGSTFSFTLPYREAPETTEFQVEGLLSHDTEGRGSRRNSQNNLIAFAEANNAATEEVPKYNLLHRHLNREKKRVLIAEDDPVSRKIAQRMVERAGGSNYEVIVAEDGQEAVCAFTRDCISIDLILMDVQMPNMGGLEATQLIRAMDNPHAKNIPIIALSAGAMKGDRESGLEAGMTDYMTKPVNYKELVAVLKRYLGMNEDVKNVYEG